MNRSQVAHWADCYLWFLKMKGLEVFLLPILAYHWVHPYPFTHLGGERDTVKLKCLVLCSWHNTISTATAWTWTTQSWGLNASYEEPSMQRHENVCPMYLWKPKTDFCSVGKKQRTSATTFVQVSVVKVLIALCFVKRENSEITKKQTKQSMESAKALALDKTIQSKEERDRY